MKNDDQKTYKRWKLVSESDGADEDIPADLPAAPGTEGKDAIPNECKTSWRDKPAEFCKALSNRKPMAVGMLAFTALALGLIYLSFPNEIAKPLALACADVFDFYWLHHRMDVAEPFAPGWNRKILPQFIVLSYRGSSQHPENLSIQLWMVPQAVKRSAADALNHELAHFHGAENRTFHALPGTFEYQQIGGQTFATVRADFHSARPEEGHQYLYGLSVSPGGNVIGLMLREDDKVFHPEKFKPVLNQIKGFYDNWDSYGTLR